MQATTSSIYRSVSLGALFAACCLASGCQSFSKIGDYDVAKSMPWYEEKPQIPSRVVGYWSETTLNKAGDLPKRGFGGRLYFYSNQEEKPVKVQGQLVVYAFDEANRDPTDNRPTRKYVFPPEQVEKHFSESEMGNSYSFWLEWDQVGGPQKEISLIARFEPIGGPVIVSEQTRHRLPGHAPTMNPTTAPFTPLPMGDVNDGGFQSPGFQAQQVSYSAPMGGNAPLNVPAGGRQPGGQASIPQMRTTTIALPQRLAQTSARATNGFGGQQSVTVPPPTMATSPGVGSPYGQAGAAAAMQNANGFQSQSVPPAVTPQAGPPVTPPAGALTTGQPAAHSAPSLRPGGATGSFQPASSLLHWPQSPAGSPFGRQSLDWDQPRETSGFASPHQRGPH